MLGVAVLGLIINVLVAIILSRGESTLNTRAALLHVMGDLLGSVAAAAAGAVILFTGWTLIDPILALLVSGLLLYSTIQLLRESLDVVLEAVPLHLSLAEIGRTMAGATRVRSVHDLHVWTLSSGHIALSAHVIIDNLRDWEGVLDELRTLLHEHYDIDHITLQPEAVAEHVLRPMDYPASRQHVAQ